MLTPFLLTIILISGPFMLGGTLLWFELGLLEVAALLFAIQGLRLTAKPSQDPSRIIDIIDLAVMGFAIYAIARWLTSPTEYFSRLEILDVIAYAGVFLISRYGMTSRFCVVILYAIVLAGVGETILGDYVSTHPAWYPYGSQERPALLEVVRWIGTYESPNHYGSLLVMAIAAAVALGSFSKLPWPARIVFFYVAVMMIGAVVHSGSRGSWLSLIAAVAGLAIMGIRNGTLRWWIPITGAAVLLAIALGIFMLSPSAGARLAMTPNPLAGGKIESEPRLDLAVEAIQMAQVHPLFGTGPATFPFVHPHYQWARLDWIPEAAHDDYLNCIDDYGLAGFSFVLVFLVSVTARYFRTLEEDVIWYERTLVTAGFAVWLALIVHSFIDYNFRVPANALVFFSITGMAIGHVKANEKGHWSRVALSPLGQGLGWGIILLSLAFAFLVTKTALSDWALEGEAVPGVVLPWSESAAAAGHALKYDPNNAKALAILGDDHRGLATLESNVDRRMDQGQQALDAYQKAFEANPLDDSLEFRMAETLDLLKKYPEALPHYLAALNGQRHNGLYWYTLSIHYLESGQLDESRKALAEMGHCFHQTVWWGDWEKRRAELFGPVQASPTTR